MKQSTRYLSMLLALVMMLGVIPAISLASSAESIKLPVESALRGDNGEATTTPIDGSTVHYIDVINGWDLGNGEVNPNCYVELKLTESCKIDAINVVNYPDSGRYYYWEAYITDDNTKALSDWTAVGGKTTNEGSTSEGYTLTLGEAVTGTYVRIYGTFNSANGGYHFNEVTLYGETTSLNRNRITIGKYGTGFENWKSPSASYGYATQMLLTVEESTIYDENDQPVTVTGADILSGLEGGTLKTQLVIKGDADMTLDINPSTIYSDWLYRFEVCLAETPFIPANGGNYEVTLNVLSTKDSSLVYTGTTTLKCEIDPVFLYDAVDYDAPVESLGYYYEGNETHDYHKTTIMLPNGIPTIYFNGNYKFDIVVDGSAVYRDIPLYNHYNWGTSVMGGMKYLEGGWFPKANEGYAVSINVYAPAYPSGNYKLMKTYQMNKEIVLEKEEILPTMLYNYEFSAENGLVYVDVTDVASRETVSCPKGGGTIDVAVPFVTYTLTAVADVPGAKFLGWYVDGEKVAETSTKYTFTAVKGAASTVVAKFEQTEAAEPSVEVKFEGYQVSLDGHDVRFVGSASNMAFETVDLLVNVIGEAGKNYSYATDKVFKTLNGMVDGVLAPVVTTTGSGVEADVVVDADYLFGYAIAGIPNGEYTFIVTPVATAEDGTKIYGKEVHLTLEIADNELTEMNGVTFTESHPRYTDQGTDVYHDGNCDSNAFTQMQFAKNDDGSYIPCYLDVDLGKECVISKIVVYTYASGYSFGLYGSNDGETWEFIADNEALKGSFAASEGFVFETDCSYRYIQMKCTDGLWGFFSTAEFDVFGYVA